MANQTAWDQGWAIGGQRAQESREHKQELADEDFKYQVGLHAAALNGLRAKLGTTKPGTPEYDSTLGKIQGIVGELREMYHPDKNPGAIARLGHHLTDALHITNPQERIQLAAAQRAAESASDEAGAREVAESAPTPANPLLDFKNELLGAGFTPDQVQKALEIHAGIEARVTTAKPVLKEFQQTANPNVKTWFDVSQPIPSGWTATGGTVKPIRGTLVRSAQSPTGFALTFLSPSNPSQIIGWQPVTPSRYYMGTTSSSSTVDPFGIKSSSQRTTQPMNQENVDLSSAIQFPPSEGQPMPAGTKAPQPLSLSQLRKEAAARAPEHTPTPGPAQLDAQGHIPASVNVNPGLREAANQLLDGMDLEKLPLPAKDKQAAAALAARYGWGQGLFTPQQKLLIRESRTYLTAALDDPALKVLDSATSRAKLANMLLEHKGVISASIAATVGLNAQEQEFLRLYNQLVGTISGLGQLTRGGRVTEATIDRLMRELPNPEQTHSSADAKRRIRRLLSEIDVATSQAPGVDVVPSPARGNGSAADFLREFRAGGK